VEAEGQKCGVALGLSILAGTLGEYIAIYSGYKEDGKQASGFFINN
jgi:hypothetical protein